MSLSNTATPIYYGQFRDDVIAGKIPVCKEIEMEMNRIDALIANPGVYYDDQAINGFVHYCENELTLTNGEDLHLLFTFKLWAEQIFGWYYFVERSIYVPGKDNHGGRYVKKRIKKRLVRKQYLNTQGCISHSACRIEMRHQYICDIVCVKGCRS